LWAELLKRCFVIDDLRDHHEATSAIMMGGIRTHGGNRSAVRRKTGSEDTQGSFPSSCLPVQISSFIRVFMP
jgi:hypothetical protein